MRREIHDSAGSFRPDVRGIHRYMHVYDEIVTALSSTIRVNYIFSVDGTREILLHLVHNCCIILVPVPGSTWYQVRNFEPVRPA